MRKRLRQVGRKSIGTPQIEGFNKKSMIEKLLKNIGIFFERDDIFQMPNKR